MLIIIDMTLGEEILVKCIAIEVSIIKVDIEVIIERITLEGVEVGLGKDSIYIILEGMTKEVVENQDQV